MKPQFIMTCVDVVWSNQRTNYYLENNRKCEPLKNFEVYGFFFSTCVKSIIYYKKNKKVLI